MSSIFGGNLPASASSASSKVRKQKKKHKLNNVRENPTSGEESIKKEEESRTNGVNDAQKKLSSKQKKRMKSFLERRAKEAHRQEIFKSLSENALPVEQQKVMQSSRTLGQKETNKQKLTRMFYEEKVGMEGDSNEQSKHALLVPVQIDTEGQPEPLKRTVLPYVNMPRKVDQKKTADEKSEDRRKRKLFFRDEEDDTEEDVARKKLKEELAAQEKKKAEEEEKQRKEHEKELERQEREKVLLEEKQRQEQEKELERKRKEQTKLQSQIPKADVSPPTRKVIETVMETNIDIKAFFVPVDRPKEVQDQRLELPILMEEQRIMEAIYENDIVIICGETGCGKTTQVPQFLYEAGFGNSNSSFPGMIGITEPRRVAAMSMAKRVSSELNMEFGKQIRYDVSVAPDAVIKFMTDGILLKEIQNDFLLMKYSAIIIDEAHERSLNTDSSYAKGKKGKLLSALCLHAKGNSLKLIIMSATLRVEDFVQNTKLFSIPPPVISVDTRQYPVTVHFNKRTPDNYIEEAYKKVCKIHRRLPPGGVLVFVTGQQEIEGLCRRLRKKFPNLKKDLTKQNSENSQSIESESDSHAQDRSTSDMDVKGDKQEDEEDEEDEEDILDGPEVASGPLHVLPLYSVLPTHRQLEVFEVPPPGTRLVVVATNIAETSLTIPGIKYVVDTGKVKELHYDKVTGIQEFRITWVSQAAANQRAGRAGRTGPGHCYRLYSSAVYGNTFAKFSEAEINLTPIEGVVLQMKSMGIENISIFPFPTPPDPVSLRTALKTLENLGALNHDETITDLGRTLAAFPVAPRLILGKQGGCLPYVVLIVATLSVRDPLLRDAAPNDEEQTEQQESHKKRMEELNRVHANWANEKSDLLVILRAIGAFEYAGATEQFCVEKFLHYKTMKEIRLLRQQLTNIIKDIDPDTELNLDPKMPPPSKAQETLLRQIVTAGLIDQVAYLTKEGSAYYYAVLNSADRVYIHPSSFLHETRPAFCVYREIANTSRPYMKGVTAVSASWLPTLGKPLCNFSKPCTDPPPRYDSECGKVMCFVRSTYGPHSWPLPLHQMEYPGPDRFKYFAYFLLQGEIFPELAELTVLYNAQPSMLIKGSLVSSKVSILLEVLRTNDMDSKDKLLSKWKVEPKYLLSPVCLWLDKKHHKQVQDIWSSMVHKHVQPSVKQ